MLEERNTNRIEGNTSTNNPKNPTTENISRIMNSSDDTSWCSEESNCNGDSDYPPFSVEIPESDEKWCCEKRMSRRKGIIYRMGYEWLESSCYFLWWHSPLWDSEINNRMYDERENDDEEYFQCPCAILVVFLCDSCDPDEKEYKSSPENNTFADYLDDMCIWRVDESSGPEKCWCISLKKRL